MASPEAVDGFVTYLAGIYGEHVTEKYVGAFRAALREDLAKFADEDLREASRLIRRGLETIPPYASVAALVLPFLERARTDRQRNEDMREQYRKRDELEASRGRRLGAGKVKELIAKIGGSE